MSAKKIKNDTFEKTKNLSSFASEWLPIAKRMHIVVLSFAVQTVVVGDFVEIVQAIGYRVSDVRRIL